MFVTFRISFLKLMVSLLMTTAGILSRCHQETLNIVDCSNAAIAAIPLGIPTKTTHLYLDHNNLTRIKQIKESRIKIIQFGTQPVEKAGK